MDQTLQVANKSLYPQKLINLQRYPLQKKTGCCKDESPNEYDKLVQSVRDQLAKDGCAVLREFLTPQGVAAVAAEADSVSTLGHQSRNRTNPYFTTDNPDLATDDPRRQFFERSNNFISADNFSKQGALRTIHDYPAFDPFIKDCLQQQHFYRYADPLADVIINMAETGNGFPWHFDTNNFTVTLAIQNSESGGEFEYAPDIRRHDENFSEVKRVLCGESDRVVSLELRPGDLQLFKGRYSLHRVAPLEGKTPRYVAIYSYVKEPDIVGSPERARQLYGKALPIHFERAGQRQDEFLD